MYRISKFFPIFTLYWVVGTATADRWAPAQELGAISADGSLVVKVTPGNSLGDTFGFTGADKGKFATAKYFRLDNEKAYNYYQEIELVNPVSPISVYLSSDGTLVTLDNWHNMGYGNVVVIYRPNGEVLKKYKLDELYSNSEKLDKITMTVSSIWWRCNDITPVVDREEFIVFDSFGNFFDFNLRDGSFEYEESERECKSNI